MTYKLKKQIQKINQKDYTAYYRSVAERIKKRRMELDLTQEELADGICSHTYISKIENNKVIPNGDQISRIMEKMCMKENDIILPEVIAQKLEESFTAFFYKDYKTYKKIYGTFKDYNLSSLAYIINFGYYVLIEDFETAKTYNNELTRYLSNLEDYEFNVYLMFAIYYNIGVNDFRRAKILISEAKSSIIVDDKYLGLYHLAAYIVYGSIGVNNIMISDINLCNNILIDYSNDARLSELRMYNNIFKVYGRTTRPIVFKENQLDLLTIKQRNFYLLNLMFHTGDTNYIDYFEHTGDDYILALFYITYNHYLDKEFDEYKESLEYLENEQFEVNSKLDLTMFMKSISGDKDINTKAFLLDQLMPYFSNSQNIYFIEYFSEIIEEMFAKRNRYKDARVYHLKYKNLVDSIRYSE